MLKNLKRKSFTILFMFSVFILMLNFSCNKNVANSDTYEYFSESADLLEAGEYVDSIKASKKAAALFKNFSAYENGEDFYYDCLVQIGEAYLRMEKTKRAQRQFQRTFDRSIKTRNSLLGIAAVYFRLNKIDEAKIFFESNIKKYRKNPALLGPLYYYYAMCLSAENDFQNARYAAQASIENYLKAKKNVPHEVEKLLRQVTEMDKKNLS